MTLRVTCSCKAQLKLTEQHADKVIKCPKCARKFRVPAAKFQAPAIRAAGASPRTGALPAESPPAEVRAASDDASKLTLLAADIVPANLDDELQGSVSGGDLLSLDDLSRDLNQQRRSPIASETLPVIDLGGPVAEELNYAQDPVRRSAGSKRAIDAVEGPRRSFWKDLAHAFAFPFFPIGNAISTFFLVALNVAASFTCFGLFVYIYMAAVYMNIVADSASGSDEYKAASLEGGVWEAVIRPFLQYLGTFIIAMTPFLIYVFAVRYGFMQPNMLVFFVWTGVGVFLWPMLMLLAATESLSIVFQPHLILLSIAESIVPYLAIWFALLVAAALSFASTFGAQFLEQFGFASTDMWDAAFGVLGGRIAGEAVNVYVMMVAMRLVGLYYLHNKHRFKFQLE